MSNWRHPFGRNEPMDPSTRERLEAKVRELQRAKGIDDNALQALARRLQTEVDMLERLRESNR